MTFGPAHFSVSNICAARDVTCTIENMHPRDNFGPAWPSRETAKSSVPNRKKVGTAGYKKLYCLCLMGWKSQEGREKDRRQNTVRINFHF